MKGEDLVQPRRFGSFVPRPSTGMCQIVIYICLGVLHCFWWVSKCITTTTTYPLKSHNVGSHGPGSVECSGCFRKTLGSRQRIITGKAIETLEMYTAGELMRNVGVTDPASWWVSQILQRLVNLGGLLRPSTQENLVEDYYIIPALLKEKALQVVQALSESHWTASCVITWRKFQEVSGGLKEAHAVLNHLCEHGKAKYLVTNKKDLMKGVKVSLSARALSGTTILDFDVLHLIWTVEKLERQLNVIDQRRERSRASALASLKLGNKQVALKCTREMKLASLSREKCTALLNRVEEVLAVIADAEASKEVAEAIRIGTQAIKENGINYDEVELCLQELNECIESQKQIDEILGSNAAGAEIDDEDIEDELKKLELSFVEVPTQTSTSHTRVDAVVAGAQESADALSDSLSNLHLTNHARKDLEAEHAMEPLGAVSNDVNREAALA